MAAPIVQRRSFGAKDVKMSEEVESVSLTAEVYPGEGACGFQKARESS